MSTPVLQQHQNGQASPIANPDAEPAHSSAESGAANAPVADSSDALTQPASATTETRDAIREGKQKAKEVMAAVGASPSTTPTTSAQSSALPNGLTLQPNGAPQLSRKRSRDGTLLPLTQVKTGDEGGGSEEQSEYSHDDILLDRYMQQDMLHAVALNTQAERSVDLVKSKEREREFYLNEVKHQRHVNPGSIFGYGYGGYGNGNTEGKTQLVYSTMRGPPKGRRCKQLHVPRKDNAQQAEQHEELVPLRLDVELDKLRLRDTFTWNMHERLISPEMFIDYLMEDLKIPLEAAPEIAKQVRAEFLDQLHNYYPHIIVEDGPLEPGRPYFDHKEDEMRIQIKLNITIGRITLVDQFEWDINNPQNSPEEFARQMAWENALSGEFTTAIAHSIREQSQLYTKSLYLTNHCFDGRPIEDPDLRDGFLPTPIYSAFRPQQLQKDWTPYMYEMSEAELERTETSMMREHRAQKRQLNRRGGPALPDLKDRQRTVRSLIIHKVIPGAVETFETTGIPKTRRSGRPGRRVTRTEGEVDSEDLDSDDSGVDSPAPSVLNAGTARTRGMRGAASAAQAAMRANYGRSATPDSQLNSGLQETRSSARRSILRDEGAADEDTLIVKLKIGKARLKTWWDEYRAKKRASEYPLSGYASLPAVTATPTAAAANRAAVGTPTATPRPTRNTPQPNGHHRATSSARSNVQYDAQGRVDTEHWPLPDDEAPPPPTWLQEAITTLRRNHKDSHFEPIMRPYAVDANTNNTIKLNVAPGDSAPPGTKIQYTPRIRCNDCPGKIYNARPGRVIEEFEVHLKNRAHLRNVSERVEREEDD